MKLYFVRHGKAAQNAASDAERPLTDKGARRMNQAAAILAALDVAPSVILTSPRLRAQQTADIIGEALGISPDTRDEVNFDFDRKKMMALIREYEAPEDGIMFVGHNPSMSEVASQVSGAYFGLQTGSVVAVAAQPAALEAARLLWVLTPDMVKAMTSLS